ncbi:hypothetical protein GGI07_001177 [Coemansia sp. Benny D115]|nr:hypothetical protein GGI07_001177 [Coemansia sp. Benny D115]
MRYTRSPAAMVATALLASSLGLAAAAGLHPRQNAALPGAAITPTITDDEAPGAIVTPKTTPPAAVAQPDDIVTTPAVVPPVAAESTSAPAAGGGGVAVTRTTSTRTTSVPPAAGAAVEPTTPARSTTTKAGAGGAASSRTTSAAAAAAAPDAPASTTTQQNGNMLGAAGGGGGEQPVLGTPPPANVMTATRGTGGILEYDQCIDFESQCNTMCSYGIYSMNCIDGGICLCFRSDPDDTTVDGADDGQTDAGEDIGAGDAIRSTSDAMSQPSTWKLSTLAALAVVAALF